jgi:predicted RNase H-like HicB family nuclease
VKEYAIIIDKTATGYGAWVPDLPGCVAAAIELHEGSLRHPGEPVPEASTRIDYVAIAG